MKNRPGVQNPPVTIGDGVLRPVSAKPVLMEEEYESTARQPKIRTWKPVSYLPYSYLLECPGLKHLVWKHFGFVSD